jgi:hypothetical protein
MHHILMMRQVHCVVPAEHKVMLSGWELTANGSNNLYMGMVSGMLCRMLATIV